MKKRQPLSVQEMRNKQFDGPKIVQRLLLRKLSPEAIISLLTDHGYLAHTDSEVKGQIVVSLLPYQGEAHPRMSIANPYKVGSINDAYERIVQER